MRLFLAAALLASVAASGAAQVFPEADMQAARGLIAGMQAQGRAMAAPGPVHLQRCGPWGVFCSQAAIPAAKAKDHVNAKSPIGPGFKALGPAGKTGKIDGPGAQGNGTYRVIANDPYSLHALIATGYIEGELTIQRAPETGATTMRFAGRRWNRELGAWGPVQDKTQAVVIEYDARADIGALRWFEDGGWKSERYWGGAEGPDMTIEFGGGWDHDFLQDP